MTKLFISFSSLLLILLNYPYSLFAQAGSENEIKKDPYDLLTKYYEEDFQPFAKGNWYVGFAFSLTNQILQNKVRLFDKVLDGEDLSYDLTFKGGYFLRDYFLVGGSFIYSRDKFVGTTVQEGDTIQQNNIKSIGTIAPAIKTYVPLTKNNRLSFFTELGFGLGFGNTLTRDIKKQDEIQKAYTKEFIFTAGISPGVTFFAMENFAFEIQLNNLIGYKLQVSNKTINDAELRIGILFWGKKNQVT